MSEQEKRLGTTYAEAEYGAYTNKALAKETCARIRQAEKKHGYDTGVRH